MSGPHGGLPVRAEGRSLDEATAAMVLLHGRGATAADILLTCRPLLSEPGWAFLAPEAAGDSWYPNPFVAPLKSNQPHLDSALGVVTSLLEKAASAGIPRDQVILLGFSQGACLALEYAARHPVRYGAVAGLSGALIGPAGTPRGPGGLAGTPVLLACSDSDPYVSAGLVEESARILDELGGRVDLRLYPGLGHEVSEGELALVNDLMAALTRRTVEGGFRR